MLGGDRLQKYDNTSNILSTIKIYDLWNNTNWNKSTSICNMIIAKTKISCPLNVLRMTAPKIISYHLRCTKMSRDLVPGATQGQTKPEKRKKKYRYRRFQNNSNSSNFMSMLNPLDLKMECVLLSIFITWEKYKQKQMLKVQSRYFLSFYFVFLSRCLPMAMFEIWGSKRQRARDREREGEPRHTSQRMISPQCLRDKGF